MIMRRFFLTACLLLLHSGLLPSAENNGHNLLSDLARLAQKSNQGRLAALQKILHERNIPFELQTFESETSLHGRMQGTNIAMTFGTGKKEITVGAHYDAVETEGKALVDGMVDNGAGTIVLVRLAEAMKGRTLQHRVCLVLFDMEELGLFGSKAYVAERKTDIAAALNLDVAAFGDAMIYGLAKSDSVMRISEAIFAACAGRRLACIEFPKYLPGDDLSFQVANIPVVSIGFIPRLEAYQLWLLLNGGESSGLMKGFVPPILKIIHTREDNLDRVEPATLDLAFQVVLDIVLKLDTLLK